MDKATIGGLILGIGAVAVAFALEGGSFSAVFRFPAILLVVVGTFGAAAVTSSISTIKNIPNLLRIAFVGRTYDLPGDINQIVMLAEKARRDGILGLEQHLRTVLHPFYKQALQLVVDGTEVTVLRDILEKEIEVLTERHRTGILFFQKLGGFSPTLGIIGTVLGLIHALSNTENAAQMASSIASAFIATLWGVALANLVYLPICDKLRRRHEDEIRSLNLIVEGVVSIQSGDNPRIVRTKLQTFVEPDKRLEWDYVKR